MRSHHRPLDKPFLNYNVFKSCQKICFLKRRWPHTFFFNFFDFFGSPKNFFIFRFFPFSEKEKREGTSGTAAGRRERRVRCPRGGSRKAGPPFSDNRTRSDRGVGEPGRGLWGREAPRWGQEGREGKGGERAAQQTFPSPLPSPPSPPFPPKGGGPFFPFFCLWQAEKKIFFFSFSLQSCLLLLLLLPVVRLPGKSTSSIVAGRRVPPSRERRWNVA